MSNRHITAADIFHLSDLAGTHYIKWIVLKLMGTVGLASSQRFFVSFVQNLFELCLRWWCLKCPSRQLYSVHSSSSLNKLSLSPLKAAGLPDVPTFGGPIFTVSWQNLLIILEGSNMRQKTSECCFLPSQSKTRPDTKQNSRYFWVLHCWYRLATNLTWSYCIIHCDTFQFNQQNKCNKLLSTFSTDNVVFVSTFTVPSVKFSNLTCDGAALIVLLS